MSKWFKITHWGRFCNVKIEEVDVIRETAQMVFYNETWTGRVRETRSRKETEDHTFIKGREAAFAYAIACADSHLRQAETLAKEARRNIQKLQDQEKS